MNCNELKQLISAYADNEITETERLLVKTHIDSCPECLKELDHIILYRKEISTLLAAAPMPFFETRLNAKINSRISEKKFFMRKISYGIACAVFAAIIVAYASLTHQTAPQKTVSDLLATESSENKFNEELLSIFFNSSEKEEV